ncbi:hypothetical protein CSOJ01_00746 [Colletotrichum sojae]|uniref:Uncharacterized protein n=1 Tax=Colletotrichum sojae TaxID=2175907 RepID=A0A8H6N5R0_9PEZI|nr:hypothetical protein CSOJ01_00746 [Colletotrichum sojae]
MAAFNRARLWDSSCHIWDVTMGVSDKAQGLNSAPVKFDFHEMNLNISTKMRKLKKLLNPYTSDDENRPSDISR